MFYPNLIITRRRRVLNSYDNLQLISNGSENNSKASREQEIASITRGLKNMAKELNVPVIVLSQISRDIEKRSHYKRPQLEDLRENSSIEENADLVAFIYRPEYYQILEDENGQSLKGLAEIIIAKNRHGGLGTVKLKFNEIFGKFNDLDSELKEPFVRPKTNTSRMSDEDLPF